MTHPIRLAHGCSLSNLSLFVAAGAGFMADEGLQVEPLDYVEAMASPAGLLATGDADIGTTAFTQPMVDAFKPDPLLILCGSGLKGLELLTEPSITRADQLAGRTLGTFRGDPLEVLAHDVLGAAGLSMGDVTIVYLHRWVDAIADFLEGRLDAITAIEPHATRLRAAGARPLSDGTELWGDPFPDTVLVASSSFLRHRPGEARAAIRAMLRAERFIEADPRAAIAYAEHHFPDYSTGELLDAVERQPPRVDLTGLELTIAARWPSLQSLNLVAQTQTQPPDVLALDLLYRELAQ